MPPELHLPEPDNISFVDSLYSEIPQHLEHALKRHHCKLIFPDGDGTNEYDFHKIGYVDFINTTTFNRVEKWSQIDTNRQIAVKTITIPRSKFPTEVEKMQVKKLMQEIQTHLSLQNSQYVVSLYGFCVCSIATLKVSYVYRIVGRGPPIE